MISLCVVARNEARRIPRLLRSVQGIVSEVCLLDNGSTDGTTDIVGDWCQQAGIGFQAQYERESKGYPDHLYNLVLQFPRKPWTLLLDADEELTDDGRQWLQSKDASPVHCDAFDIPRTTIIIRDGDQPLVFNECHFRYFRTGSVKYPEGDRGPHQVAVPLNWERSFRFEAGPRPFFIQYRDAREQLARDKGRGQYPETRLPDYWETVPGWMDYEKVLNLLVMEANPYGAILEVGCWLGKSTCYLGQKAKESGKHLQVWAVDHFCGSDEQPHREFFAQGRNLYAEFMRNVDAAGLMDVVTTLPVDSAAASRVFADGVLDSVFLDASHDYKSVVEDIKNWLPKVRKGGILAGHDWSSAWPGVCQATVELLGRDNLDLQVSPGSWVFRVR